MSEDELEVEAVEVDVVAAATLVEGEDVSNVVSVVLLLSLKELAAAAAALGVMPAPSPPSTALFMASAVQFRFQLMIELDPIESCGENLSNNVFVVVVSSSGSFPLLN